MISSSTPKRRSSALTSRSCTRSSFLRAKAASLASATKLPFPGTEQMYDTGKMVSILGTENGWTEIIANGVTGYVKSEYVVRGDYTPGSSVVVAGGDASGIGVVIVPDGPVNGGIVNNNNGTVIPQAEETDFLGILPD